MMPNQKNIMLRFSFIILVMVLIGIAIICKAGVIMFAERQYWKDVADRFVKENVTVRPTRGNIISSDGQLMASSLPEYKIYMDFMINKRKGETEEEEKTRLKLQHIKDSVLYANLDTICKGLHEIFPDKSAAFFKQHIKNGRKKKSRSWLLYPKRISYIQYKEAKRLPVFNLNKYKGGFHEQAFNQRKKAFWLTGNAYIGRYVSRYRTRCKERAGTFIRFHIKRQKRYHSPSKGNEQIPEHCRYSSCRWL